MKRISLICLSLFITCFTTSTFAELPKALLAFDFIKYANLNGVYLYSYAITNSNGHVSHVYWRIDHAYLISNYNGENNPTVWYAKTGLSWWDDVAIFIQDYRLYSYMDSPAKGIWIDGYGGNHLAPLALAMDNPTQVNPDSATALTPDPINTISGDMILDETDLTVNSPEKFVFDRKYISSGINQSVIGQGWTHTYDWLLTRTSSVYIVSESIWITNDIIKIRTSSGAYVELIPYVEANTWKSYKDTDWSASLISNSFYKVTMLPNYIFYFSTNGFLTKISNRQGNDTELTYDNSSFGSRLTRAAQSSGLYLSFSYLENKLVEVDTPFTNYFARYAYNAYGDLTNATIHTFSIDKSTEYLYDTNHILIRKINAAHDVYDYAYQTNNSGSENVVKCTQAILNNFYNMQQVAYHPGQDYSDVTFVYDSTQATIKYCFDTNIQRVTQIIGPFSNIIKTLIYNSNTLDVVNESVYDGSVQPAETISITRSYNYHHNVLTESTRYNSAETNQWNYSWDDTELLTSMTDPENRKVEFEYTNGLPRTVRIVQTGSNYETHFFYSTNGLLIAVTNANGHWNRFLYDNFGQLTSCIPQCGPTLNFERGVNGVITKVITPNPLQSTSFSCDEMGIVNRIDYPNGTFETFYFDEMDRITNHVDATGRSSTFAYLPGGKLSFLTHFLNENGSNLAIRTSFQYDRQFNCLKICDPLDRTVEAYKLDLQDRPVVITNLEGQTTSINYGIGSYIKSLTRFDGSGVSYSYNGAGLLSKIVFQDSTNVFQYLKNNRFVSAGNEQGVVSNSYNGANRITSSKSTAPNGTVSYAYYPAGQISNMISAAGALTYILDGADRVERLESPAGVFLFSFNSNNGLIESLQCTNAGILASYSYDIMNNVTGIVWRDSSNRIIRSFNYDVNAVGLITALNREDGSRTDYSMDSLDRLTHEIQRDSNGVETVNEEISYDLVGNRTSKTRDGLHLAYKLGLGNRLNEWWITDTNLTLKCDVFGSANEIIGAGDPYGQLWVSNVASVIPTVTGTNFSALGISLGLGTQNVIAAICDFAGNTSYATSTVFSTVVTNGQYLYSNAGCVTSIVYQGKQYRQEINLSWDAQYQLTESKINSTTAERYGYDALGRRTWTWDGVSTNWHVYDGVQVVADVNATGGLVRSYVWGAGIDNMLAMTVHTGATAVTYYALNDHLGTVHALVDASGAVVESYRFDAWGRVLGVFDGSGKTLTQSAVGNRYLWQGREYSWKTSLYNFRARWYDPVTGRWLSNDPSGISGGLNQYVFCGNDPVNKRDPLGLCEDSVTYEFMPPSEQGYLYLFLHQPRNTIYATSSQQILQDLAKRDPYSLNTINISNHGAGDGVVPLGDIQFRQFSDKWNNVDSSKLNPRNKLELNEYLHAKSVFEAIASRMAPGGRLNIIVCNADSDGSLQQQLQGIMGNSVTVNTWGNSVTFFFGHPIVPPGGIFK